MRYRNILITLNHINLNNRKNKFPDKLSVLNFFKSYFLELTNVIYCVVASELHKDGDFHYHIGIKTSGISERYFFKKLRLKLIEFDGRSFDIQFKKGFNIIAQYLIKEDEEPLTFGISLEELKDLGNSIFKKKTPEHLIEKLKEKNSWDEVIDDPIFSQKLLHNYSSLKKLYDQLHIKKEYMSAIERYNNGLLKKRFLKNQEEININNLFQHELDVLLWVCKNIFTKREFRQDQLLIIGESQTGKSTFIRKLIEDLDLKVYEASSDDFSHYYDKSYDLILLDEFNYKNFNRSFLLKLLDGSILNYTGKFKEFRFKRDNIPIILICNPSVLPNFEDKQWDALKKRLLIIQFNGLKNKNKKITNASFLNLIIDLLNQNNEIKLIQQKSYDSKNN